MGDRLSVAQTTFVGSRARVNLIAAAGNILAIARKARATVTLTMSALAHLFVVGTTVSIRMNGRSLIVAGKGTKQATYI